MSARSFDINKLNVKQSNIRVVVEDSSNCAILHNTCIVAINNFSVTLNSGGWRTTTTKVAINRALSQYPRLKGYGIFQKKGQWFVSCPNNEILEFVDGMSINL